LWVLSAVGGRVGRSETIASPHQRSTCDGRAGKEIQVTFTLEPMGDFSLARSIGFLEAWPASRLQADDREDQALRFSFCAEHDWQPVGVRVSQRDNLVNVDTTRPDKDVADQVARILSLDVDGTALVEVARRDPVVAHLVRSSPGLRPVCFWSPWEAACWAVLSQRTSMSTASALKQRISRDHGTPVVVDGREMVTFPAPQVVLDAPSLPGVNPVKLERIHGLAAAALDGTLTAEALRAVPADDALATLRELPGIGPFSAALILIRGAGAPDVFTTSEPRLAAATRKVYDLPEDATEDRYRAVTDGWRPLRSWVSFLLRAASEDTLDQVRSGAPRPSGGGPGAR
jgi:DNA-3-methyladenine glycosylase II